MTTGATTGIGSLSAATETTTAIAPRSSQLGQDAFLTLLVTQLQHQDPTDPMEDAEFISQLATFSQLEKLTEMSESLKVIEAALAPLTEAGATDTAQDATSSGPTT